jgi:hypothetical protein
MFECYTRERRFRYYEAGGAGALYIERTCDGKTVGIGDGVDMFHDEDDRSIPVGTEEFYQAFRASILSQSEPLLNLVYFGE